MACDFRVSCWTFTEIKNPVHSDWVKILTVLFVQSIYLFTYFYFLDSFKITEFLKKATTV